MAELFNPNNHLMQLQGKDYLPVAWRLCWFRDLCPEGTISTELVTLDLDRETTEEVMVWNNETKRKEKVIKRATGFAVFHARVADGKGGSATGTKSEKAASFPAYIEKTETKHPKGTPNRPAFSFFDAIRERSRFAGLRDRPT